MSKNIIMKTSNKKSLVKGSWRPVTEAEKEEDRNAMKGQALIKPKSMAARRRELDTQMVELRGQIYQHEVIIEKLQNELRIVANKMKMRGFKKLIGRCFAFLISASGGVVKGRGNMPNTYFFFTGINHDGQLEGKFLQYNFARNRIVEIDGYKTIDANNSLFTRIKKSNEITPLHFNNEVKKAIQLQSSLNKSNVFAHAREVDKLKKSVEVKTTKRTTKK